MVYAVTHRKVTVRERRSSLVVASPTLTEALKHRHLSLHHAECHVAFGHAIENLSLESAIGYKDSKRRENAEFSTTLSETPTVRCNAKGAMYFTRK